MDRKGSAREDRVAPRLRALMVAMPLLAWGLRPVAAAEGLFVVTSSGPDGNSDLLALAPPWTPDPGVEPVGPTSVVRYFFGLLYVVDRGRSQIQVIDPSTLDTLRAFSAGEGTTPHDILLPSPDAAWITRYDQAELLKVDPVDGSVLATVDLSGFADADGVPEMSMMARDGDHLFVQIQRLDLAFGGNPAGPSYLAVVDLRTDQLLDVDPDAAGVQGIQLVGQRPRYKMQVFRAARRLFVSAPGPRLDVSGGIEEIDLDRLVSLGFILREEDSIGDLGAFAMYSPDAGYAIGHTDIIESSHLQPFVRGGGNTRELFFAFGIIERVAIDPVTLQMFLPDHLAAPFGVRVFDAPTGALLTPTAVPTSLPPRDLAIVRPVTPGEARELRVDSYDPAGGELAGTFRPACGASDHGIAFGPLGQVSGYLYTGEICGLGSGGTFAGFDPGDGSYFFVLFGIGDAADEGSYGTATGAIERPERVEPDPICTSFQDLSFSCDG